MISALSASYTYLVHLSYKHDLRMRLHSEVALAVREAQQVRPHALQQLPAVLLRRT